MKKSGLLAFIMCAALVVDMTCYAQQPVGIVATNSPTPYGSPITLDEARSVMEAAVAEAKRISWFGAIAIVGPPGDLIYYQKLDNAGYSMAAQGKAYTAATYRRPTKVFQEALAAGNNVFLSFPGLVASEGGIPITINGKIVGAIGASGGTAHEDGLVATAGARALK